MSGWKDLANWALAGCIAFSVGGVLVVESSTGAGRGGAIALIIALLFLFLAKGTGTRAFILTTLEAAPLEEIINRGGADARDKPEPEDRLQQLETKIQRVCENLVATQKIDVIDHKTQNIKMAIGSAVGTFVWGFGDLIHPLVH